MNAPESDRLPIFDFQARLALLAQAHALTSRLTKMFITRSDLPRFLNCSGGNLTPGKLKNAIPFFFRTMGYCAKLQLPNLRGFGLSVLPIMCGWIELRDSDSRSWRGVRTRATISRVCVSAERYRTPWWWGKDRAFPAWLRLCLWIEIERIKSQALVPCVLRSLRSCAKSSCSHIS